MTKWTDRDFRVRAQCFIASKFDSTMKMQPRYETDMRLAYEAGRKQEQEEAENDGA